MAVPTPHRRAFSQIQNTLTKSKATIGKNVSVREEIGPTGEKENADQLASVVLKCKEASFVEKESFLDLGGTPEVAREAENKPDATASEGDTYDYLDNFDFDAPIEVMPPSQIECQQVRFDDFFPPEERLSSIGPHFWNRILLPSSIDFDNKENMYEDLYANLGSPDDSCDIEEIERGLANLELQKFSLDK